MTKRENENIDTTPRAGSHPENTGAWSLWATKHLSEMRTLRAAGVLGLKNPDWRNITEHSLVVNATSMLLATKLAEALIGTDTIDQASMLHDVTKRLEKEQGINYATEPGSTVRQEFLSGFGYQSAVIAATEYTGRAPEMFIENAQE